ncbi:amino acid ABC transporter permease [Legionella jordanis]|uniref:Amino acid (Glutamine) ABC transporter permease n=1 Tax=Legionella jordanis TaxID=456 RepID=A0A0W0VFG3_9GAMM|nr:amino acid ABC transporter permease [Legionella jordanis]KTD18637.1 amino acid (glutamine) ABC transporter permease [Legionella jordanis]RMX00853.1 amino acid ABC transporter permease [Legionella jordanis]RMX17939.1 amino acid ABC transporter permease [Legionella jordanis]VEH11513.1 amino acid (glutamine) ABC transporter permease [Legionella jordanis]HAT8715142.1 ABC transporter permease subunit [Legionella jordanis]
MSAVYQNLLFIGQGMVLTLLLLIGGLGLGLLLGTFLAISRHLNWFKSIINRFISLVRGTPLILQLSFVYFALPQLLGLNLTVLTAGILTFGLNSSAYIAEILRAGIEHIPNGQFEAAKTLEIPAFYVWKDIILPQVLKNILPALINESIALLKETALISTIGGMDLMRKAQALAAEQFSYFLPLCIAGLYYYGFVVLIEYLSKKIAQGEAHVAG